MTIGSRIGLALLICSCLGTSPLRGSDHADPIDPFNKERLEGGITDLFVFPVKADDSIANAFDRTENLPLHDPLAQVVREKLSLQDRETVDAIVFILCLRRHLTQRSSLRLTPYTYQIHIDFNADIAFPNPVTDDEEIDRHVENEHSEEDSAVPSYMLLMHDGAGHSHGSGDGKAVRPTIDEAFARYGGKIETPSAISEELRIILQLDDNAQLKNSPRYRGRNDDEQPTGIAKQWQQRAVDIKATSGVFDDPFIFPTFFGTNTVGIVVRVPIEFFPAEKTDYLIWATSSKNGRQVDHVGRSLRTQNPRFELLNTLHPSKHAAAISSEHEHPSLMRDLGLRFNLGSLFAYRKWDFVPDVMCFSTQYPVGFPNGRLLTDDVAAILAQHGDTLLYELSYQDNQGTWPRQTANDRPFKSRFPFLADPQPEKDPIARPRLATANIWKLIGIVLLVIALLVLENWIVARLYHRYKSRRRYL